MTDVVAPVAVQIDEIDRRPLVSIIVPAFNEALIIMSSLTTLHDYMVQQLEPAYRWEMIVVDDGSTDETGEIAELFAKTRPRVRVLRHAVNFRLGQALRYAFAQSAGDYVVTIDSDLSYSPDHIGNLLEAIRQEHAKIAVASPYMKGGRTTAIPFVRKFMSRTVNRMLAAASQQKLSTYTGMVRAYDGPFIRSLNLKAMGPEINTEILYKAQVLRSRVVEVPAHLDWTGQTDRLAARKVSLRVKSTTKLYVFSTFILRPLSFFVIPGLFLLAISSWTLLSVVWDTAHHYSHYGGGWDAQLTKAVAETWQERPQSFIVGGICLLLAVQLISFGLLALQAKRYFEEMFHLGTRLLRDRRG